MNTNFALTNLLTRLNEIGVTLGPEFTLTTGTHFERDKTSGDLFTYPEFTITVWAQDILKRGDRPHQEWLNLLTAYRKLKHRTGPWTEAGEAPYVYLTGRTELPFHNSLYVLRVIVYGTHECHLINEKERPITEDEQAANARRAAQLEAEANALRTATSKVEKEWSCTPNLPKGESHAS